MYRFFFLDPFMGLLTDVVYKHKQDVEGLSRVFGSCKVSCWIIKRTRLESKGGKGSRTECPSNFHQVFDCELFSSHALTEKLSSSKNKRGIATRIFKSCVKIIFLSSRIFLFIPLLHLIKYQVKNKIFLI